MPRATASPRVDRTIRLGDGRQMAYAEWGDLAGRPLVFLHGTPASRLLCLDEEATEAAGVRLLTVDRPGYGLSDPQPGRTVLGWVDDFVELAGRLDLMPCPVVGWSGGGPYALALGFRLPDRITRVGFAAASGPPDPSRASSRRISDGGRAAFELLRRDYTAGVAAIEERGSWFSGEGWETMFAESGARRRPGACRPSDAVGDEDADSRGGQAGFRRVCGRHDRGGPAMEVLGVGHRATGAHLVWRVGQGLGPDHSRLLVGRMRDVTVVRYPDEAHLFPFAHWGDMLAALR